MNETTDDQATGQPDQSFPPGAEDEWRAVPQDLSSEQGGTRLSAQRTRLWALTLEARRIRHRVEAQGSGWRLLIPPESHALALDELRRYEAENRDWPPRGAQTAPQADNVLVSLSVLALLAIFHNLLLLDINLFGHGSFDWLTRGNADAGAIRAGEWWRTLTALSLHADGLHLLGNLCIGGLFISLLCRALGSGLGWSLLLAGGALGNLLNAWLQSPLHRSVGASTAVFGAVGLLAALNLHRPRQTLRRRLHLSLAAALALLALLGSAGENTDLGAHLFGLAAGLSLGLPTSVLLARYGRPGRGLNALLALAALGLMLGAWWAALRVT